MDENQITVLRFGAAALEPELHARGFRVAEASSLSSLLTASSTVAPRAIVLGEPALSKLRLARHVPAIRRAWPLVDVLVWSPRATPERVRVALQAGARDVMLDDRVDRTCSVIEQVIEAQQLLPRAANESVAGEESTFEGMISRSPAMIDLFTTASQVAQSSASVLILGETGTGKELLARAIHRRSRRPGAFVALNCAAVPESLIDSELFGHVEGAFTGATRAKPGLFRHADGGTLLLDEVGSVPDSVQSRLLRVLQEEAVRPVGGTAEIGVDVRVIAATSATLEEDVIDGKFRADLFYRLDVIRLELPSLRQRTQDIIYLFAHFSRSWAQTHKVPRPRVTDGFLDALMAYPWPGNVRQLENFAERLVLTEVDRVVDARRFEELVAFRDPSTAVPTSVPGRVGQVPLDFAQPMDAALQPHIEDLQRTYLRGVLKQTKGRIGTASQVAGISRRTMSRLLGRLEIDKALFKED
ncbi:MAG: sigma-54 interaction domain-containing protein [Myxococcota bacterium]